MEAQAILEAFETDTPELIESVPLVPRALELALRLDESVYDCLYVAAAIESEAALVTADARLARAARGVVAEVELLA
jgi:predicted nucleic acid-binding protein